MTTVDRFHATLKIDSDQRNTYVHSPQIPGLHLVGADLESMRARIENTARQLLRDNHGVDARSFIWTEVRV